MAAQAQPQQPSGTIKWDLLGNLGKLRRSMFGSSEDSSTSRPEFKRRRSPVQLTTDDESPQKRFKRSEPLGAPKSLNIPPRLPVSSAQPAESVKKLTVDAVKRLGPITTPATYGQSDAQSVTSTRTGLSRAPSMGLSFAMNRIQLQSPSAAVTPIAGRPQLTMRPAGVAQKVFNVNSPLAPLESISFPTKSTSPSGPMNDDRMGATLGGATFGPMRQPFHRRASTALGPSPPKSPPGSKPVIERHAVSAPWAGRNGSLQTHRLGDGSLGRGRTISLVSAAVTTSSGTSSPDNDRKTPTPKDGSVTSPASSSVGSPPPAPPKRLGGKPLEGFAQRALKGIGASTPLNRSQSFTHPYMPQTVKVPLPSQGSSATGFSKGSDAASVRSHSKVDNSEKPKHEKAASSPYIPSRENHQSRTKKILDKRREEEKELLEIKREKDEEVRVEAVKPDEEITDRGTSMMDVEDQQERTNAIIEKSQKSRMSVLSSDSNSTVGRSQLRVGREKTNHTGSIAVSSTDSERTRIPASQVVHRFDPKSNSRLQKVITSGRFSVPPDEEEEEQRAAHASRMKSPPLVIPTKPERAEDMLASEPMNISPVKESAVDLDSNVEMASTTPTQSSMRTAFSMTPLGDTQSSKSPEEPKPMETGTPPVANIGEKKPPTVNPEAPGPTPTFSFAPSQPKPNESASGAAPVPPKLPSFFVPPNAKPEAKMAAPASNGGFDFLAPSVPTSKPVINPLPFSFGNISSTKPQAETSTTTPSMAVPDSSIDVKVGSAPTFFAPPKPAEKGAPKVPLFGALSATRPDVPKSLDLGAAQGIIGSSLETPKPSGTSFSFGNLAAVTAPSAVPSASLIEPRKDAPLFSFGPPKSTSTPPSVVPATPSAPSNVASTTPASLSLGMTTTPQSSPFSFGSESSSPIKALDGTDLKTPTRGPGFTFNPVSTTPAATPAPTGFPFSQGQSTTPAATPSAPPFSFGAPTPISKTPAVPFGTSAPSTTVSTTSSSTPAQNSNAFSFSFGGGANNPFQTTPIASKPFVFGDSQGPTTAPPSFSFGPNPVNTTPKPKEQSNPFTFGQAPPPLSAPATGSFSFGSFPTTSAPGPAAGGTGLVFPSGPTTPLQNKLELDSMDSSPIRGGGGTSSNAPNPGAGQFGFGNTNGFGSSTASNLGPFGSSNNSSGSQNSSVFGGTGFTKESSAPPALTFGSGGTGFGQQTPTSANPFSQPPPGFGSTAPFSFGQNAGSSASPFGQAQPLPSPVTTGFGQTASPAASPFNPPASLGNINIFGAGAGVKRPPSPNSGSDVGAASVGDRKIMPMPKPRRARTQAETRNALAKFHRGP
ncbi:hypothetical protein FRC14_002260 [Serendipita sp. 396]|nr:hypothetical protein FRC14_002260 [Serendipita sp. 396]